MRNFLKCVVGIIVLLGISGWAMGAGNVRVDSLVEAVLSKNCRERNQAVESIFKSADTEYLQSLRTEIMNVSPQAAAYLKDAFDNMETIMIAAVATEQLIKSRLSEVSEKTVQNREKGKKGEFETAEALAHLLLNDVAAARTSAQQAFIIGYMAQQKWGQACLVAILAGY